jgi:hypothetical protein
MVLFKKKEMNRFINEDEDVVVDSVMEAGEVIAEKKRIRFAAAPATIVSNVSSDMAFNLDRLNQLELTVADLKLRLTSMHELLSRAIETNVHLRAASAAAGAAVVGPETADVPMYDSDLVQAAAAAAGVTSSGSAGGGSSDKLMVNILASGDNARFVIKGKTFDVKDDLKRQFGAQWDASLKSWVVQNSSADTRERLNAFFAAKNFNVQ